MASQDSPSAHRRQTLPFLLGGPLPESNGRSESDNNNNSTPQNKLIPPSPSSQNQLISPPPLSQSQSSPNPAPDSSNSTPTTPNSAASSPSPSPSPANGASPSPPPANGATNVSGSTPTTKLPGLVNESPSPLPSLTPVASANVTTPLVASPKNDSNVTTPPAAATPTHVATSDANINTINTIVSTVEINNVRPSVTPHRNLPPSTPAPQGNNSNGLSGGAITGIAIVAGIMGFILLFWVGVQMLQSKRRRREEAEMQEIDFYPSGGGSVNGGLTYSRTTRSLDRQPSASNSFNYSKGGPAHYTEPPYGEGIREEGEYIEATNQEFEPGLQRQGTLGGSSAYSGGYYNNPVPQPPAPYSNYSAYSHQFGMQPPQATYEQHPYEYPLARAPTGEFHQGPAQSNPPTGEYHHGHAPSNPPPTIEYQH